MNDPIQIFREIAVTVDLAKRLVWRSGLLVLCLVLAALAFSPTARAVSPAPDGGYANANTAEGEDALLSLNLTQGLNNTGLGFNALAATTTGDSNTAVGSSGLISNTTGSFNTASGAGALSSNTTGLNNTAIGFDALDSNTTGYDNTASGVDALTSNTTGNYNTASGLGALYSNTTGSNNTASGFYALLYNTIGKNNVATGLYALYSNTNGSNNLANGVKALYNNTTGVSNMATGYLALLSNTTGFYNMANGSNAMVKNTTGSYNVAEGLNALRLNTTGNYNTVVGLNGLVNNTTGNANVALGVSAGSALTTGSNNIEIGNVGVAGDSGKIRLGTEGKQTSTYVAGISGVTVPGGVGVIVDANGHLGTVTSSARFKEAITPMAKASEAILALQPVTFHYKKELDPDGIPQFGLVAEQVEKVDANLVARDEKGKAYTVRYEAVNAMLLNEFLKAHRKVEEQQADIAQLKSAVSALMLRLKEQAVQIHKVSTELAAGQPTPQRISNSQ